MDERRWFFCPSASARISKIFTLTWHNVDFVNPIATVTNENAKSGKARALLLNNDAIKLLRKLRFKNNCEYVFCSTNKRLYDIYRRDFERICTLLRIENFHLSMICFTLGLVGMFKRVHLFIFSNILADGRL